MKTTVLPSPEEIMARLTRVSDAPWNVEHFYPLIAAAGGSERAGVGLPLLFELAIGDVSDSVLLDATLRLLVPEWIRAIVDDPDVLADALTAFGEIHGGASKGVSVDG